MGLGALFTRSVQYVATDTKTGASQTFTIFGGLAPSWGDAEYSGGMALPGAWRCSLLLSDILGGVPWAAYERDEGGAVAKVEPTPALLEQPAPPDPLMATFSSLALDLIWHGNAIALIASRDENGWPTSITGVPAETVQIARDSDTGRVQYQIGNTIYDYEDVLHVKGPCRPGALRGFGVMEAHLNTTLALAGEQARQARSLGSSAVPSGLLKSSDPDFEKDDADALKANWLASQQSRTVAVLSATTTFEPLSWNPTETQLLEARRFSLHETALVFGLEPAWLGISGSSMTYQNIEQQAINLLKFSVGGHLARLEQTLTLLLPRGVWAKANLDGLLRADTASRYAAHQIGLNSHFLTIDEVRDMEDRPPLTAAQKAEMTSDTTGGTA